MLQSGPISESCYALTAQISNVACYFPPVLPPELISLSALLPPGGRRRIVDITHFAIGSI
jgi:hypothetical protein